jgi:hypothetical protein
MWVLGSTMQKQTEYLPSPLRRSFLRSISIRERRSGESLAVLGGEIGRGTADAIPSNITRWVSGEIRCKQHKILTFPSSLMLNIADIDLGEEWWGAGGKGEEIWRRTMFCGWAPPSGREEETLREGCPERGRENNGHIMDMVGLLALMVGGREDGGARMAAAVLAILRHGEEVKVAGWFWKDLHRERYCFKFARCWKVNQISQGNTVCLPRKQSSLGLNYL